MQSIMFQQKKFLKELFILDINEKTFGLRLIVQNSITNKYNNNQNYWCKNFIINCEWKNQIISLN